jgi:hypothetical protein
MVSVAILAVGILGVAQVLVLASNQGGLGRRVTVASAIARDFIETAQRWNFDDPRLAGRGCETDLTAQFPASDDLIGAEKAPKVPLDFTAAGALPYPGGSVTSADSSDSSDQGVTGSALGLGGASYDGQAVKTLVNEPGVYQLLWSVRDLVPVEAGNPGNGCAAKLVSVVVRYPLTGGRYNNVIATTMIYDPSVITQGGIPERI